MDENAVGVVAVLFAVFVALAFFGLAIWSLIWVYGDAEKRGKSGCLVAFLIGFFAWPWGLLIWLIARPEDKRFD